MKTKLLKSLSLVFTLVLLLSALPLSASAAVYLDFSNSEIVAPTVTPNEFEYGTTYRDLKVEGGSLSYNGEKIDGYWGFEDWTLDVKPAATDEYVMLSFFPTDTATYSVSMFYPSTDEQKALMPKIKVIPLKATVEGEVTATSISVGDTLGMSTITGKVVDKNGSEITGGKWSWVSDGTKGGTSWKVLVADEFTAQWKCTGYENIEVKIPITPMESTVAVTGVIELPKAAENLVYFEGMTLADIPLNGGKAVYEGKEIAGHFEWRNPANTVRPDRQVNTNIVFVPDEAEIAAVWSNDKNIRLSYYVSTALIKKTFEITKTPEQLVFTVGRTETTATAASQGFEFAEGVDASLVMLKWEESLKGLTVGTYDAREITVYVNDEYGLYEEQKISLPIKIIPRQDNSKFCFIDCTTVNSNNEGRISVSISYHSQYKNGTATIKLSDGTNEIVLAENVPPTYVPGEKSKRVSFEYEITQPGSYTYTATATYIPGEGDEVEFTNPVVSSYPVTITVKPWRTLTAVNTKYEASTLKVYEGKQIAASTSLNAEDFDCWEFTDASGKVIAPEAFGLTAEQMKNFNISFTMIDQDITLTAKEKKLINIPLPTPGDGDNGDGFFAQVKAFFENLFGGFGEGTTECPVLNWLKRVIEIIVAFFTGFFNGLAC